MFKLAPLIAALAYAFLMLQFSVWRTKKTLAAQSHPLVDGEILALAARMATALEIPTIKVNVFEVEAVNGLAAPDGQIYLTQGFLARYRHGEVTAEELASVIAHELGHVALGHTRRRMIDFTGQNAVFVMLSALLNRFLPGIGIWIANLISTALMARMSRRDEFEADAYACAHADGQDLAAALVKLYQDNASTLTPDPLYARFYYSHPPAAERLERLPA